MLAQHNPSKIYCAARNEEKALQTIQELKQQQPDATIEFLKLDLTDLNSVQQAARTFIAKESRLDILLLNAGIMATSSGQTKEGYEIQFGTNHVGHALLTKLLLPTLLKTAEQPDADVRTIWLSSRAHLWTPSPPIVFEKVKTDMADYSLVKTYAQSKLSNLLYASQMAKHYPQITSVALHPGLVYTAVSQAFFGTSWLVQKGLAVVKAALRGIYLDVDDGARNQIWAATVSKDQLTNGGYYDPVAIEGQRSAAGKDEKLGEELWEWTEKELAGYTRSEERRVGKECPV